MIFYFSQSKWKLSLKYIVRISCRDVQWKVKNYIQFSPNRLCIQSKGLRTRSMSGLGKAMSRDKATSLLISTMADMMPGGLRRWWGGWIGFGWLRISILALVTLLWITVIEKFNLAQMLKTNRILRFWVKKVCGEISYSQIHQHVLLVDLDDAAKLFSSVNKTYRLCSLKSAICAVLKLIRQHYSLPTHRNAMNEM